MAAEAAGWRTALVDLDPQASAAGWGDDRDADGPAVEAVPSSRLAGALRAARTHGAHLAVIDTAPHSEAAALEAARASDLALVPLRPGVLDLRALRTTADICALAAARTAVVLNQIPARGRVTDQAAEAVEDRGPGGRAVPDRVQGRVPALPDQGLGRPRARAFEARPPQRSPRCSTGCASALRADRARKEEYRRCQRRIP